MTLLKKIFEGCPQGFYDPAMFAYFMSSSQFSTIQGVAQEVIEKDKGNGTLYDIKPYGVQIRYEHHSDDEVEVYVSGDIDKVRHIEEIFLQQAGTRGF